MALALGAGIAATIFFVGIAAACLQLGAAAPAVERPQASARTRGLLCLLAVSIIGGISGATGLLAGSVVLILGALVACMFVSWAISGSPGGPGLLPGFAAVSWACLTGFARFDTWDLGAQLGAQTVVGPALMVLPLPGAWAAGAAGLAGLVGAAQWVTSMPPAPGSLQPALRWCHSALTAAAVSAILLGPSAGALVHGGARGSGEVTVSLAAGALSVAAVAALTRLIDRRPALLRGSLVRWIPSAIAFTALGVAVVVE